MDKSVFSVNKAGGVYAIVASLSRLALSCNMYIYLTPSPSLELIPARAVSLSAFLSTCARYERVRV